jgi:hypothetical protein
MNITAKPSWQALIYRTRYLADGPSHVLARALEPCLENPVAVVRFRPGPPGTNTTLPWGGVLVSTPTGPQVLFRQIHPWAHSSNCWRFYSR